MRFWNCFCLNICLFNDSWSYFREGSHCCANGGLEKRQENENLTNWAENCLVLLFFHKVFHKIAIASGSSREKQWWVQTYAHHRRAEVCSRQLTDGPHPCGRWGNEQQSAAEDTFVSTVWRHVKWFYQWPLQFPVAAKAIVIISLCSSMKYHLTSTVMALKPVTSLHSCSSCPAWHCLGVILWVMMFVFLWAESRAGWRVSVRLCVCFIFTEEIPTEFHSMWQLIFLCFCQCEAWRHPGITISHGRISLTLCVRGTALLLPPPLPLHQQQSCRWREDVTLITILAKSAFFRRY